MLQALEILRSVVARDLQASKSLTALQALEVVRSLVAPALQASKSLTALQALEVMCSLVVMLLKSLNWTVKLLIIGLVIVSLLSKKLY